MTWTTFCLNSGLPLFPMLVGSVMHSQFSFIHALCEAITDNQRDITPDSGNFPTD